MTWLYPTMRTLLFALLMADGRAQTMIDTNQQVNEKLAGERACTSSDWHITSLTESKKLLEEYGYNSLPTGNCQAVDLPWLPSAHIVQLTGTQNTDIFVSLTFVRASNTSRLWVIPVNGGLHKYFDAEDDLHNIAALNDLLKTSAYKPNEMQIVDLARLYMFFVGHSIHSNPEKLSEALQANNLAAEVQTLHGRTKVILHRVGDGLFRDGPANWELDFELSKNETRLISVNPQEQLHETGKD